MEQTKFDQNQFSARGEPGRGVSGLVPSPLKSDRVDEFNGLNSLNFELWCERLRCAALAGEAYEASFFSDQKH